jgi:twitching motility protein PilU
LGNYRVNCFWQKGSASCVIRFVTADIPRWPDLHLPQVLASLIMEKRGWSWSWAPRARASPPPSPPMIDFRNEAAPGHILTMEDPVEYVFTPKKCLVNQREVGNDTHSFHDALRNAMRQAPDIILIGEIRDLETCRMALTYALSGPPVPRHAARQQRLPGDEPGDQLLPAGSAPDAAAGPFGVAQGGDLAAPHQDLAGTRVPAMEVLLNTRNISELIEKGEIGEIKDAMEKSMSPGSQTFEQDLFRLVRQGKISSDEALANADSATNLGPAARQLGHHAAAAGAREGAAARRTRRRSFLRRVQDHRGRREVLAQGLNDTSNSTSPDEGLLEPLVVVTPTMLGVTVNE